MSPSGKAMPPKPSSRQSSIVASQRRLRHDLNVQLSVLCSHFPTDSKDSKTNYPICKLYQKESFFAMFQSSSSCESFLGLQAVDSGNAGRAMQPQHWCLTIVLFQELKQSSQILAILNCQWFIYKLGMCRSFGVCDVACLTLHYCFVLCSPLTECGLPQARILMAELI